MKKTSAAIAKLLHLGGAAAVGWGILWRADPPHLVNWRPPMGGGCPQITDFLISKHSAAPASISSSFHHQHHKTVQVEDIGSWWWLMVAVDGGGSWCWQVMMMAVGDVGSWWWWQLMMMESENNDLKKITSSGFDQKINDYVPVIAWTFLCCIVLKGKPIVEIFFRCVKKVKSKI